MVTKVKRLAIIGSTGSIGRQTLEIVRALPEHFRVVALGAGRNLDLLAKQIKEFHPECVSCLCMHKEDVRVRLNAPECRFIPSEEIVSCTDIDIVVMAISGAAGLEATLAAVRSGKTIALANKESLVTAGEIITKEARKNGAKILPVDSEHSAIWQCLQGEKKKARRIILTASGGPFRRYSRKRMAVITAADALNHPTWKMGAKVTIDSATLMNKGLEVIEARWLFNIPIDDITVLVHPQSIIHSMVEFADGSIKAQMSCPDMRLPIQYALTYPERTGNPKLPRLDWDKIKGFTFELPDMDKFPSLGLAIAAGKEGGTCPAVLCAADETAVDMFLAGRITFSDIPRLVKLTLHKHQKISHPSVQDIVAADKWGREIVLNLVKGEK
jgi:1-deoxy-D-xylulose-5-phosphate reductoisomerase